MQKLLILTTFAFAAPAFASWAAVPLEVLVDEADLIVVGNVTKVQDGGFFTLGPLKSDHIVKIDVAVVEASAVLKALPQAGKPQEVCIGQPGMRFVTSATVLFRPGQQGIWLLTKDPGPNKIDSMKGGLLLPDPDRNVYWAKHPSQFQDAKKQKEIVDLLAAKGKPAGGKEVDGLVASAEVVEQKSAPDPPYLEVRFRLKNISDKPITICDYAGNQPLKVQWIGPDGKTLERSDHYGWLRYTSIRELTEKNFVTIPAGGVRWIGPQGNFVTTPAGGARQIGPPGETSGIIFQPTPEKPLRFGNVTRPGKHWVTVSYVNREDGKKFNQQKVWTGTVTANEVVLKVK